MPAGLLLLLPLLFSLTMIDCRIGIRIGCLPVYTRLLHRLNLFHLQEIENTISIRWVRLVKVGFVFCFFGQTVVI